MGIQDKSIAYITAVIKEGDRLCYLTNLQSDALYGWLFQHTRS